MRGLEEEVRGVDLVGRGRGTSINEGQEAGRGAGEQSEGGRSKEDRREGYLPLSNLVAFGHGLDAERV